MADLNIFGVAQPTVSGISTILNLLKCHPSQVCSEGDVPEGGTLNPHSQSDPSTTPSKKFTVWFSAREEPLVYINRKPFVLRESNNPLENLKTYHGISASRLEAMEARLKEDVLREIQKWNQLLLVHEELEDGKIVPTWTAVDDIQTPREVFQRFADQGYPVKYVRIPVSPEQAPDDHYLDEYVETIRSCSPEDSLVFNCGMGVGRTTFAMVVAMIIRRAQLMRAGVTDPLGIQTALLSQTESQLEVLKAKDAKFESKTTLRLVYMLEQGEFSGRQLGEGTRVREEALWAESMTRRVQDPKSLKA
jgi:predicted protein tyrosine phosphatase